MGKARYEIERVLGRGGMSTVYLAVETERGCQVALKVLAAHLADDEEYRARFLREGRVAARVVHANIVRVYGVGEDERGPYIAMEYVAGRTLAAELGRQGRLPPDRVVEIGVQVSAALAQVHAAGLVHRDVTPQNILLGPEGTVKLSDFGIARPLDGTRLTEHGAIVGTAAYLAPEQARGEPVTAAADIYALGVVLYELLTGRPPFRAESLPALLLQREQGAVVPPHEVVPNVPPSLEEVVLRCLERLPADRPASAEALSAALSASLVEDYHGPSEAAGVGMTRVLPAVAPTERLPVAAPTRLLRTVRSNWGRLPLRQRPARRRRLAAFTVLAACAAVALALAVSWGGTGATTVGRTTALAPPSAPPPTAQASVSSTGSNTPAPQTQLPSCAALESQREELEQQREAVEDFGDANGKGKGRGKHKGEHKQAERAKRAIDAQLKAIEHQSKACR